MAPVSTPVSDVAVQVYVPAPAGVPSVTLNNTGNSPVYVGGSAVTPLTGLQVNPGDGFSLAYGFQPIYAVSGSPGTTSTFTTLSADAAIGTSTLLVSSSAGFTIGGVIAIGATPGVENATIAGTATGTISTITATKFDHKSGENVTLLGSAQPVSGAVTVLAGTR